MMQATRIITVALCAAFLTTTQALTQPAKGGPPTGMVPFLQPQAPAKARPATAPARAKAGPRVVVGDRYPNAHLITEPGRYGLSVPPDGTAYAVIGHTLARVDRKTFKVLSILRSIEGPRD